MARLARLFEAVQHTKIHVEHLQFSSTVLALDTPIAPLFPALLRGTRYRHGKPNTP